MPFLQENRPHRKDCSDSDAALQSNEPSRRPCVKTQRFTEPAPGYFNGDLCINIIRVSDPPHAACSSPSENVHHSHRAATRTTSLATNPTVASVAVDPYPAKTSQPANLSATSIPTISVDAASTSNVSSADDSCYSATASLISTEHLALTEYFENSLKCCSLFKIFFDKRPHLG
uniref:Uncharacterized protein n=1 Tax=Panagrolaimus superbus TaxID=310955 RepID=A0A914Y0B3_9BILA